MTHIYGLNVPLATFSDTYILRTYKYNTCDVTIRFDDKITGCHTSGEPEMSN